MARARNYPIVSADGMIADGNGVIPATIRNDADQRFFQGELAHLMHPKHEPKANFCETRSSVSARVSPAD